MVGRARAPIYVSCEMYTLAYARARVRVCAWGRPQGQTRNREFQARLHVNRVLACTTVPFPILIVALSLEDFYLAFPGWVAYLPPARLCCDGLAVLIFLCFVFRFRESEGGGGGMRENLLCHSTVTPSEQSN